MAIASSVFIAAIAATAHTPCVRGGSIGAVARWVNFIRLCRSDIAARCGTWLDRERERFLARAYDSCDLERMERDWDCEERRNGSLLGRD